MFGGLIFLLNGHMCCGVRNTELLLRLSPEGAGEALRPAAYTSAGPYGQASEIVDLRE